MRNYFYVVKFQLVTTKSGVTIAFHFTAGKVADAKALNKLLDKLPPEASLYGDSTYTDYGLEKDFFEQKGVLLKIQHKKNSKHLDNEQQAKQKTKMRKRVEVTISDIKKLVSQTIHAVTLEVFLSN